MSSAPGSALGVTPTVTIVVIAHNEHERIGDCLSALLAQDVTVPFDVLVVDDGSTDHTSDVVAGVTRADARVGQLRLEHNRGRGAARLAGQRATAAPFVGFVDADVIVPPDWLRRCLAPLPACGAVSAVALPDGDCAVIWRLFRPALRHRVGHPGITGNNVVFDAAVLRAEPFNERSRIGEDFRLAHRLLRSGVPVRTLGDLTVQHREAKSYTAALRYMWELGFDAASHPVELRILRVADLAWALWAAGIAVTGVLGGVGVLAWWWPIAGALGLTLGVNELFMYSRFTPWRRPLAWLAGSVGNLPLMTLYLLGRTAGLGALLAPARRRTLGLGHAGRAPSG